MSLTVKEEKTDNELIAEFMGEVLDEEDHAHNFTLDQLPYRTNWNWLMPVVEKIGEVDGYSCINIDSSEVYTHRKNDTMLTFTNRECGSKILSVYKSVIEFIKWYNSQKS